MSYDDLVKSLDKLAILNKWLEVTPLQRISGIPTSSGGLSTSEDVFDGHDEEQVRLMEELCIVLDYNDKPVGAGTKKLCHLMENIDAGLLHRAFSVFLFNEKNELLLQQRADEKITFPNMWTNTCCSHPLCVPSELGILLQNESGNKDDLNTAIAGAKVAAQRKLFHELGIPAQECPISKFEYLTRIHYKSASGVGSKWGEHEIDYIFIMKCPSKVTVDPNYNEVKDHKFVSASALQEMFKDSSLVFTPWFRLICETFLFEWWENLSNLSKFQDEEIHRLL